MNTTSDTSDTSETSSTWIQKGDGTPANPAILLFISKDAPLSELSEGTLSEIKLSAQKLSLDLASFPANVLVKPENPFRALEAERTIAGYNLSLFGVCAVTPNNTLEGGVVVNVDISRNEE